MTRHVTIWLLISLVAATLVVPAWNAEAPVSEDPPHVPHPPIIIHSNAEFDRPGSGVVKGDGTEENPYVIEGWVIPHPLPGISLYDTDAHVIIRDVRLVSVDAQVGVDLVSVRNVTIERVEFLNQEFSGVYVDGSDAITVRDSVFRSGVRTVDGITNGHSSAPSKEMESDAAEERSDRMQKGVFVIGGSRDVRIVGNAFRDVDTPVETLRDGWFWPPHPSPTNVLVCGNDVEGHEVEEAFWLPDIEDAVIAGNRMVDVGTGVIASPDPGGHVLVERNVITGSPTYAADLKGHVDVHLNVIDGNVKGVRTRGLVNATHNWWGDASGPSGHGSGTGDPLEVIWPHEYVPDYEPWLTEPPAAGPDAVDCGEY